MNSLYRFSYRILLLVFLCGLVLGCAEAKREAAWGVSDFQVSERATIAQVQNIAPQIRPADTTERDDWDLRIRMSNDGRTAILNGVISDDTPGQLYEIAARYPSLNLLVLANVPGSVDDEANLYIARWVRKAGLSTFVPRGGEIASGGVDFYLAGVGRFAHPRARFGVHSWGECLLFIVCKEGREVARDAPQHQPYLSYYRDMGTPQDFYWFTLTVADLDEVHWMTRREIDHFDMVTHWLN
ncbi:MAG: hypothetical protein AAF442_09555 [Pseudomonadota bacterium]